MTEEEHHYICAIVGITHATLLLVYLCIHRIGDYINT